MVPSDDQSRNNVLLWIAGIVLLSLGLIGISLATDGFTLESKSRLREREMKKSLERDELTLQTLEPTRDGKRRRLEKYQQKSILRREADRIRDQIAEVDAEKEAILEEASEIGRQIEKSQEDFDNTRLTTRRLLWRKNRNRALSPEDFRTPKRLRNPRIKEISPTGVVVQHTAGVTRFSFADLSPEICKEFDFSAHEAENALKEMRKKEQAARIARIKKLRAKRAAEIANHDEAAAEDERRELAKRKLQVKTLSRQIERTEDEIWRAENNDRSSSNRSVPGSLETWAEKARRLRGLLRRYEIQYETAVGLVRQIDPDFVSPR